MTKPISYEEAAQRGLHPLTTPYKLPFERWMLDNLIAELRRGRIEYALVGSSAEVVEVWRKPSNTLHPNGTNGAAHHYKGNRNLGIVVR